VKTKPRNRIGPFVNGTGHPLGAPVANGHPVANGKPAKGPPSPDHVPPAPAPAPAGRDPGGRFQLGCRPGPGNPFAKRVAGLRKALLDSVTEADVARLGRELMAQAVGGDVAAAKVLLSYVVGKPTAPVDPDRVELEAWKLLLSWPTVAEVLAATWAVRPAAAAQVVEAEAPATGDEVMKRAAGRAPLESAARIIRRREEKGR